MSGLLFWDVDTQMDFLFPGGKLYVPGAEKIVANLKSLTEVAASQGIPIVATTDAHLPSDPEFAQYPPHCLAGTPGQRKVEGTVLRRHYVVPNRNLNLPANLDEFPQIVIEKQATSVFTNPNTEAVLERLGEREIVVYGVVTEICVDLAARGLIQRGYRAHLVRDAIQHLDAAKGWATIEYVRQHGGRLLTTGEVRSGALLGRAETLARKS